jgi:hypothetical protein
VTSRTTRHRPVLRKVLTAISAVLVAVPLVAIFDAPAYANTTRCSDSDYSGFHLWQEACMSWLDSPEGRHTGGKWHGPGLYSDTYVFIDSAFNKSHVKTCLETVTLYSSYGSKNVQTRPCADQAKGPGEQLDQWNFQYSWGVGRSPGDGYELHACVTIDTTVGGHYDSCTSGTGPWTPTVYKP